MEVKLINGKWKAVFDNTCEEYNTLTDVQKKLFGILLRCEIIIHKSNLKTEPKSELQLYIDSFLAEVERIKTDFTRIYIFITNTISIKKFKI